MGRRAHGAPSRQARSLVTPPPAGCRAWDGGAKRRRAPPRAAWRRTSWRGSAAPGWLRARLRGQHRRPRVPARGALRRLRRPRRLCLGVALVVLAATSSRAPTSCGRSSPPPPPPRGARTVLHIDMHEQLQRVPGRRLRPAALALLPARVDSADADVISGRPSPPPPAEAADWATAAPSAGPSVVSDVSRWATTTRPAPRGRCPRVERETLERLRAGVADALGAVPAPARTGPDDLARDLGRMQRLVDALAEAHGYPPPPPPPISPNWSRPSSRVAPATSICPSAPHR